MDNKVVLPVQKILFIGDTSVGKSSLLQRYTEHSFTCDYLPTIGVDFKIKNHQHDGTEIKAQIWDTSGGRERFRTISSSYYRGAHGFILCFDTTNEESFQNCEHWSNEIEKYSTQDHSIILVGTKCDLVNKRQVDEDKIQLFAVEHGLQYFETSSKTGENVDGTINEFLNHLIIKNRDKFGQENARVPKIDNNHSNGDSNYCTIL
eukprot:gene6425-10433_t